MTLNAPLSAPVRIVVIGTGYLGATHGAAMAELGFEVLGVDTDEGKVSALTAGKLPFFEPGLPELLGTHVESGRLRFTSSYDEAADFGDVFFVCVGTPQQVGSHAANLSYVESAVREVGVRLRRPALLVGKSTVPVGTAASLRALLAGVAPDEVPWELVWNPEFLREGKAVDDTQRPDRIVIGGASAAAEQTLRAVYAGPLADGCPLISCDLATAELVKVSANAFLATKISFINAIAEVCDAAGADVRVLADALGHDVRIGRKFLDAGIGFGGGCLPKDIRALVHRAGELGAQGAVTLLHDVDEINMGQRQRVVEMAVQMCGGSVLGKEIAVLGAAFKPLTDDVRDSPALNIAAALHLRGASVQVYDPEAGDTARRTFPTLAYATSADDACERADLVLVLTEWEQFRALDPVWLAERVGTARVIDARACLDQAAWQAAGWQYRGLGRAAA